LEYPFDEPWGYDRVVSHVQEVLRSTDEPAVLVAESYSGPAVIEVAAAPPASLRGVVLVATFATAPWPSPLRHGVTDALFRRPPPRAIIRRAMVGLDASDDSVSRVREALSRPLARVMSRRLRDVLAVDVRDALARVTLPALVVRATHDRMVPARRDVATTRPDLECVEVDAPHLVLHSQPQRSAAAIEELLVGLP